jgi:acyl-coenzyme A synthetase/AMP-(fatty) acid ligase/acyl carrier protein
MISVTQPATIPDCIRRQAEQYPERPAVFDPQSSLTFREFDKASGFVAQFLMAACGTTSEAVLLLFDVNTNAVVASLGVMKAAKFFVGVDPTFPPSRLVQIMENAGVTVILTDTQYETLAHEIADTSQRVVNVEKLEPHSALVPEPTLATSSLALLNYTSGSTGIPKAVMQSHESALAQATRYAKAYQMTGADRATCFGSLAWAGSFWDSFGSLAAGVPVGMYDLRRHGLNRLGSWLTDTGITILCGATVLRQFAQDFSQLRLNDVRFVEVGGDTIYARDVIALQRICPQAIVAAGMGMSEAGRIAEHFIRPGTVLKPGIIPVGYPVRDVRILLLTEDGDEVRQSEVGEFVVQSSFLAQGYWQSPELTGERFRQEPRFGNRPLYYTGDLGRQLSDGRFHHMGRKDYQIKIHGHQLQTNEIEALLLDIDEVLEACVVVHDLPDADQELVAYLVPDLSNLLDPLSEIVIPQSLPRHMHPQRYIFTAELPKTPTGKINRRKIMDTPSAVVELEGFFFRQSAYEAPQTFFEKYLANIWAELLQVDRIGRNDKFIDLGGDSIDAIRIFNFLRRDFGVELPFNALFDYPTVATFSSYIVEFCGDELEKLKTSTD